MSNIIGIAGRKGAGKSTMSEALQARGYTKVSFADFLKESSAELYGIDCASMYDSIAKEQLFKTPLIWDQDTCGRYSKIVGIPLRFESDRIFASRRELLQFLGTDVLRKHDEDFHIRKTREKILGLEKCYVDDLRFENEKELIEELGGIMIFLIRPANFNYSNHSSEITLRRNMFDHVLVNDGSEEKLHRSFEAFMDCLNRKKTEKHIDRNFICSLLERHAYDTTAAAQEIGCSRDKIVWWAAAHMVRLDHCSFKYDHAAFHNATPEAAYWAGILSADGCVKKSGKSKTSMVVELSCLDYELVFGLRDFVKSNKPIHSRPQASNGKISHTFTINSPYIVEDMKLWDIFPQKSKCNKID